MEFKLYSSDFYLFCVKKKMPSGMTTEVCFDGYSYQNYRFTEFIISLDVYHKRKQVNENILKQTGKDGLSSLLFAKQAIVEFEEYILNDWGSYHKEIYLKVLWEDSKRKRVYERGLKDLGFFFSIHNGDRCLLKKIK